MNIRFLAQSEYFNGLHIKDDIVLEKEYEQGPFTNLPKVRYYLYYLEENVRKEVMPFSDKVDVFNITNCQNESEYLYFTEYSDMHDGTYVFSIVRYNITDHTHTKIISLKDNINLYPDNKQIKIFILDESNLIIQRALPRISKNGILKEFFDYSLILFNFDKIGDTLTSTKTTKANKAHAAINAAISIPVIEPFLQSSSMIQS